MTHFKAFLVRNFEQVFVFIILGAAAAITYFVDYKIAFLNFYFLPIILSGYYLGTRKTLMGAVLSILMISLYAVRNPELLHSSNSTLEITMSLVLWGAFLILAGAVVGVQHEKLSYEMETTRGLNKQLASSHDDLNSANAKLREYTSDLENKVKERTVSLEQSKQAIEILKAKVEETLFRTMDRNVAKLIIDGRLRTEKRQVSVLFSDLCSFTEFSNDKSPELVIQQLNRYLQEMETMILRYSGHIDKYIGDGIMAEFGAPLDLDRHSLLAAMAALKMKDALERSNFPWKMRIGIASGMSTLGMIGSKRQSYTAIGDTVNLASRLETVCPPGGILINESAAAQVREFLELRPFHLGADSKLKGFKEEFRLFEIVGRKSVFAGNPAFPPRLVAAYLPEVESCGVPEETTLPVEALDGTIGHSQKVALIAASIVDELKIYSHEKKEIIQAAFAADCGKAIIPLHILNRRGLPSELDLADIRKHPDESARIMSRIGFDSTSLLAMIRCSHERMNGRGYPEGISGEQVPLGSRIISVADAYVALTSDRPYREKWEMAAALQEIERGAEEGKFDPQVVKSLRQILGENCDQTRKSA